MPTGSLISGGIHSDERGSVSFVNDFDMEQIKRFYTITHSDTHIIRGWQGHKIEKKWFFCTKGAFVVRVIKIDDWHQPSKYLEISKYHLQSDKSEILFVDQGCVTCMQAVTKDSTLLVFSDQDLLHSKADDYRFDQNYWHL